ncbi:MAG: sulfite exporter TauE/SafE family protein [Desulfovibrionaceae bacterium]
MYFPISGVETPLWLPPLAAFIVSFFTSMGGVSGAFLLLPFQMSFLGYASPSVSATNQLFNVVATPSGVYRYFREGRLVWPLAAVVAAGTLPGVFLGAVARVAWFPNADSFRLFAGIVLLYIGIKMARDLLRGSPRPTRAGAPNRPSESSGGFKPQAGAEDGASKVRVTRCSWSRIGYEFHGERYDFSTPGIFALCFVVGVVGGTYGIGGGSIIAPFFVTVFGLPVYTVAGAALLGTFITSVAGVVFFQVLAPLHPSMAVAPDWMLGLLFGLGGMAGMYLGARLQKRVPARIIKGMLTAIVLAAAMRYVFKALA